VHLLLAAVGKLKAGPDRELFDRYWDRLQQSGRKVGITSAKAVELPESRATASLDRKSDEATRLLRGVRDGACVIALDETGKAHTSETFAAFIRKQCDAGIPELALLIGGPDGHSTSVRTRADLVLNLGTMTLPHGLARIVLAEQLYRATTILTGHPYHRV
jgi:23S rRNA (pseudouridine1915-N3)-methyltransferase